MTPREEASAEASAAVVRLNMFVVSSVAPRPGAGRSSARIGRTVVERKCRMALKSIRCRYRALALDVGEQGQGNAVDGLADIRPRDSDLRREAENVDQFFAGIAPGLGSVPPSSRDSILTAEGPAAQVTTSSKSSI